MAEEIIKTLQLHLGWNFAVEQWKKGAGTPGCLGDLLGDEILPSYMGIILNHYKDPY